VHNQRHSIYRQALGFSTAPVLLLKHTPAATLGPGLELRPRLGHGPWRLGVGKQCTAASAVGHAWRLAATQATGRRLLLLKYYRIGFLLLRLLCSRFYSESLTFSVIQMLARRAVRVLYMR